MAIDNHADFAGNLTRDPELKFTKGGQAVVNLGVAINESYKDKNDEWQSSASFVDVAAWGQLAENAAATLKQGDRVVVRGKIKQQTWETDEGDKRSKIEFVADEIAVSLKWATVDGIEKNERDEKPSRSSGGSRSGGGRGRSSGSSRGRSQREEPDEDFDEEPF